MNRSSLMDGQLSGHLPSGRCGLKSVRFLVDGQPSAGHLPSGRCGLKSVDGGAASPPFGEVWIEMNRSSLMDGQLSGHLPSGRCGLKSVRFLVDGQPSAGHLPSGRCGLKSVDGGAGRGVVRHLPSGRCGLKSHGRVDFRALRGSPPFGEVWIEMTTCANNPNTRRVTTLRGGALRGGVD